MLKLKDYPNAFVVNYFEDDQEWPDTPENEQLLQAYDEACRRAAGEMRGAMLAEKAEWGDLAQRKAKAEHWHTVAETLGSVLSLMIRDGSEILLPDPWK